MKVLGLDSSMTHTGWMLTEVFIEPEIPAGEKQKYGVATYNRHKFLDRGTFKETDTSMIEPERIIRTARQVHCLIHDLRPDVVAIEDTIGVGIDRSVTGVALFTAIMAPFLKSGWGNFLTLHPTEGWINFYKRPQWPMCIISITPERLQWMTHWEKSTKARVVKERFLERSQFTIEGRFNEHEADAYFIGYEGTRFYLTCLSETWPKSILSEKETSFFLTAKKKIMKRKKINGKFQKVNTGEWEKTALLHCPGRFWWNLLER